MPVRKLHNLIDGKWAESTASEWTEIKNPNLDEAIALCPMSTVEEVDAAIGAATKAFWGWRTTPATKRVDLLFRLRHNLDRCREELMRLIIDENGKSYLDAQGEIARAIEYVEHACAAPELLKGSISEDVGTGVDTCYIHEPLGPFAIVAPFNFPAMIPLYFTWAVACGDPVIVKPSELCPLTMIRIAELAQASGFPPGVLNVVLGGPEVVKRLITHPDMMGVSFVGSSRVAEEVYKAASLHGKRAQCQGGAKNHLVVTDSARVDDCMPNLINSCYGSSSQRCFAGSNVLVFSSMYEQFRQCMVAAAKQLVLGYGADREVTMGPVISRTSLEKMHEAIEEALREGAKLVLDGRNPKVPKYPKGYFLGPTLLEAEPGMKVFDHEVFGPVRCLKKVRDLPEALSIIDRSEYGHTAAIYTENGSLAREFARIVNTGQVGINIGTPAPIAFYPVGGRKLSFFGSLRGRANDAISFYTDKKVIVSTWHTPIEADGSSSWTE